MVSIGVILAIPGIADAVRAKTVVGVSPVIGGAPVRGMADACLAAIGVKTTAAAVAAHYGPDLLDGWLVDSSDASAAAAVEATELAGIEVRALPLYMTDVATTAMIAQAAIDLADGARAMSELTVTGVPGLPEITPGASLAELIVAAAPDLADGDILVVTSKIISKAEGRVISADREEAIAAETVRVVARRGPTTIAQTRHGLVLAAAGVDRSNTAPGTVVLLPEDPDESARRLRKAITGLTGQDHRRAHHRHDGPPVAQRPDRHGHRRGRGHAAA